MQILYLHQFFITRAGVGGTRSYEFARRFVASGHRVRMVTAGEGTSTVDGIDVVGVPGAYSDYMSATAATDRDRMLAFGRFAAGATAAALRGPRPDVIYATSPPLTIALPALAAAARWRAPLVFEVRDLWPEAPIQMGALANPRLQRQARSLERQAYRRARRVIALSPGIRDGVIARRRAAGQGRARAERLRPRPVPAGAAARALPGQLLRHDGRGQRPDRWRIEAARLLPDMPFVLMGDGKRRAELERARPAERRVPRPRRRTSRRWPRSPPARAPA